MLKQMETTWDDIEVSEQGLGFDDLSLERYRQDLVEEFNRDKERYQGMPKGVYTGFQANVDICTESGIIALLGYPAKPPKKKDHTYHLYDLIYINQDGEEVLLNQKEILDALTVHKDNDRYVPEDIDRGEERAIKGLVNAVQEWLKSQAVEVKEQEDGSKKTSLGKEGRDILGKLKRGDKTALTRVKQGVKVDEKYQLDKFDLIAWFLVTA
jgi:hypothetical protein